MVPEVLVQVLLVLLFLGLWWGRTPSPGAHSEFTAYIMVARKQKEGIGFYNEKLLPKFITLQIPKSINLPAAPYLNNAA